jgi:hypothetical protein
VITIRLSTPVAAPRERVFDLTRSIDLRVLDGVPFAGV